MFLKTALHLFAGAAALIASSVAWAASAALTAAYLPPGVYRVDTQGNPSLDSRGMPAIKEQYRRDGTSGSVQLEGGRAGQAPVTNNRIGPGPANVCVKPLPATDTMPAAPNCAASAPVVGPGGVRYAVVCGGVKFDITLKKIDAMTWEYTMVRLESGVPITGLPQDFARMRRLLNEGVKTAATPEGRATAAATLARMEAYEAEMKKNDADLAAAHVAGPAEQGSEAGAGNHTADGALVQRYTRIADVCKGPEAR